MHVGAWLGTNIESGGWRVVVVAVGPIGKIKLHIWTPGMTQLPAPTSLTTNAARHWEKLSINNYADVYSYVYDTHGSWDAGAEDHPGARKAHTVHATDEERVGVWEFESLRTKRCGC